ncbi:HMG1/2-like protein [Rosa chinensis]|uniref:HMG1/2-like protein n=1 Tax=Rosa chinensis TaxID=74649 RepID=UPI000D087A57|nr:HMG1/2-like protein [Rosa chinensis]
MKGLKSSTVASKKPVAELLGAKAEPKKTMKKEKVQKVSKKKDADAPKRPAGAFFIFMEEFRKSFKLEFPDAKSGPTVGKAGGEKWKSLSATEKAPYVEKASKRKAEYEIAMQEYEKKKLNCSAEAEKSVVTEKSASACEIHDDEAGQEVSS